MGRLVSWLLLIGGAIGSWFVVLQPARDIVSARTWTPMPCVITQSAPAPGVTLDSAKRPRLAAYVRGGGLALRYQYTPSRSTVESSRYSFLDGLYALDQVARARVLLSYPLGRTVTCYVNPADSQSSVLNRGITGVMLLGLVPLFMVAVGLAGAGLIPSTAFGPVVGEWIRLVQPGLRMGRRAHEADVKMGFHAALFLVAMAVWNLVSSLGDETAGVEAHCMDAIILTILALGYQRGSLSCAAGLLAYPATVLATAVVFGSWPDTQARLTSLLVASLPEFILIDPVIAGPQRIAAYVREVASFSIILLPLAVLLGRAISAMGRRGAAFRARSFALVGAPTVVYLVMVATAAFGTEAYAQSRQWLDRPMSWIRGPMSLPEAEAALHDPESLRWRQACTEVNNEKELPAVMTPYLIRAASSEDDVTRAACLAAIGRLGAAGEDAVPELSRAISDGSPGVRRAALQSLLAVGARTQASKLKVTFLALSQDKDPEVRRAATDALSVGISVVVSELSLGLKDPAPEKREKAALSLWSMGSDASPATAALATALGDADPRVRQRAAEALSAIGLDSREAAPALRVAVQDSSPVVRSAALGALVRVEVPSSDLVGLLVARLSDPEDRVRVAAVMAIASLGPAGGTAVPALIPLLSWSSMDVRLRVVGALGAIGPEAKAAVPQLRLMLREKLAPDEAEAQQLSAAVEAALKKIQPAT